MGTAEISFRGGAGVKGWLLRTRYTDLAVSLEQSAQEALDNMQAELEDLYARHA